MTGHTADPQARGAGLAEADTAEIIERALEAARDMLGMDMAYLADTREGTQAYRAVTGDGASFGAAPGAAVPLDGTYCSMLLAGELDGIVEDATQDPRVRELAITRAAGIGSYIGVPVVLPDGGTYGTFCCLSHAPEPELRERDLQFMHVLARLISDQLEREALECRRRRAAVEDGTVAALLAALAARDGYTEEHSAAIVELAIGVARELGLSAAQLHEVEHAALLHDIGKIGVSDAVLRKPTGLSDDEWAQMRRHPVIGEEVVGSMPSLAHLAPVIRAEHERWDGGGYPDGLAGKDIPLASRIVFVCDAFHAMTSDRPYRNALPADVAVRELLANAGTQFCPTVVRAANAVLSKIPR